MPPASTSRAWTNLESAFRAGEPVTGFVARETEKGFVVDFDGVMALLPRDETERGEDILHSQTQFVITKLDPPNYAIIVSRRRIFEEDRLRRKREYVAQLKIGEQLTGIVVKVIKHGAVVNLGATTGFLSKHNISWQHNEHPNQTFAEGDEITAAVSRIDHDKGRVNLSLKHLVLDPWPEIEKTYLPDSEHVGRVVGIRNGRVVVELEPGIEAFVRASEVSWGATNGLESCVAGGEIRIKIKSVERMHQFIRASVKRALYDSFADVMRRFPRGTVVDGTVTKVLAKRVLVAIDRGVVGCIPRSIDDEAYGDLRSDPGDKISVAVSDVDEARETIFLEVCAFD